MTGQIEIRAIVWKFPLWDVWCAKAYANDGTLKTPPTARSAIADSWPEAMQAAYKLRADLDAELMTEVHANRAARRLGTPVTLCEACGYLATERHTPEACEAARRAERCECSIGMHSIHCPTRRTETKA